MVLQCLLRYGSISRQQIAEMTTLTQATISKLISELIEENLILEKGYLEGAAALVQWNEVFEHRRLT